MHRAVLPSRAAESGAQTAKAAARRDPLPTLARQPASWSVPAWVAGLPAVLFVLAVGFSGCALAFSWAGDSYNASIMTDRLLGPDRSAMRRPLPESVAPPAGNWTRSTAGHLAHWAIFLTRYEGGERPGPEEIVSLLERALEASPINREARMALAQLEPPSGSRAISLRSLGQSRDTVSLSWSARRLLAAGKKQAALKLYGQALALAISGEAVRSGIPRFSDDPGVPRYYLPGEESLREIVREIVTSNQWPFADWSVVLPPSAIISLAAARLLREQGRPEAATLLDAVLEEPPAPAAPVASDPVTLAARAEACALKARWKEADLWYRRAIGAIDDDTIRRSWWFNLSDIAHRLDDERQRQAALRAALAVATSDDITRRVTDIQRATRARPPSRSTGVKAN